MSSTLTKLQTKPLSPAIGAEILGVNLGDPNLSQDVIDAIEREWYASSVLLFRNQDLSEDAQIAFAQRFGELKGGGKRSDGVIKRPGLSLVTNIKENGRQIGILPDGEMQFHSDQCYYEKPSIGTILYAIQVPSKGGNTCFGNMYKAYDTLPADIKAKLEGRRALNIFDYDNDQTIRGQGTAKGPTWVHPVVRVHPQSGRKALFVNRLMTSHILDMPAEESEALLNLLFDHLEQPQFVYSHPWRVGDMLMWDNRCTVHARTDFDPNETRLMRRVTMKPEAVA